MQYNSGLVAIFQSLQIQSRIPICMDLWERTASVVDRRRKHPVWPAN